MTQHNEKPSNESAEQSEPLGTTVNFADEVGEGLVFDLGVNNPDGFNEYGVRENQDGSIDVIFRAMEPGIRNGYEVSETFLKKVARTDYSGRLPFQQSHSFHQRDNVGWVESDRVWFQNDALWTMGHVPNTGSSVRNDVIADFTHEPPAIQHGSVQFDQSSIEIDWPEDFDPWDPDEDRNPTFIDGKLMEFSLTPFPGGYDKESGGLSPAFDRLKEAKANAKQSQGGNDGKVFNISRRPYQITER